YGRAALGWLEQRSPTLARTLDWVEAQFRRWGAGLLLVAPTSGVALLAGAARSRFAVFLPAVTVGQALWIGATVYVGDAVAVYSDRLTHFLGRHLLESTLACVALVAFQQARSRLLRRRRLRAEAPLSGSG
ncbi:MAG TPA: hypothetical protein VGQ57_01555, partial [Polyangiaceae bacterium]|nr:hypothetical protein [Polyangiaceae bacterium]